ncbi:hypothetical protein F4775DRAFT_429260 [Biscogniauxia sp. FL1348]|nr:hypothetical protein F4775DRAFT_429260 [Biscogniauxia sp. FL1348]
MGCCFSSPSGSNAPYSDGAPSPSARAINSPPRQPSVTDESTPATRATSHRPESPTQAHRHRTGHHRQPLAQHIDKPLRRHEWVARDRAWTRTDLDTERADFFDTRVTGRPEVWQVIRAALEVLWEADASRATSSQTPSDQDGAEALATAQSILRAAEVTLPTGNLSNGVYDALGNYYALPEWIVCDPSNVAEDSGTRAGSAAANHKGEEDLAGEEDHVEEVDEDEALRRREEKGKGVVDIKNLVKVRARLSENYPDVVVSLGSDETVRSMTRKIEEESGLPSTKRVRVAYMGKILKENTSLQSQGWKKGHVVNALVFNR